MKRNVNIRVFLVSLFMALILFIVSANVFIVSILGYHLNSGTNIKAEAGGITTVNRVLYGQRGTIFDRNNEILAVDNVAYTLYATIDTSRVDSKGVPHYVVDKEEAATVISDVIKKDRAAVLEILNSNAKQVEFGVQGKYLTQEQRDILDESKIPGLGFYTVRSRSNPGRTYISKFLGYADYNENNQQLEGRLGIEELYNKQLSGTNGRENYQKDNNGYKLQSSQSTRIEAVNGNNIKLTIDDKIQSQLERSLQEMTENERVKAKQAWGIVLEAKTGRILAMGEYPGFNPEDPNVSYMDMVTQGVYEPGSTMKTIAVASAIEHGVWDDEWKFDSGAFYVGQENGRPKRLSSRVGAIHTITNANNTDYGTITYKYGYAQSSNVMISELMSNHLKYEDYLSDLRKLRFFQSSDIDGYPVAAGSEPSKDDISVLPQISNAFGQGMTVSMVQIAQAYTTFMGDGSLIKPYLIDSITDSNTGEIIYQGKTQNLGRVYSSETAKHMRDLMRYVVTDGSAQRFKMDEIEVIGKTGTAEMVVDGAYSSSQFVYSSALGFPYDDPEIIVYTAYIAHNSHSINQSAVSVKSLIKTIITALSMDEVIGKEVIKEIKAHKIDSYINESVTNSVSSLKNVGMMPVVIGNGNQVISQYPTGGQSLITNEKVFLRTEGNTITMPDMKGWSTKEVVSFWTMSGIPIEMVGKGHAVSQSVEVGTPIDKNMTISIKFE